MIKVVCFPFVLGRVVGFSKCSQDSIRTASRLPKHFKNVNAHSHDVKRRQYNTLCALRARASSRDVTAVMRWRTFCLHSLLAVCTVTTLFVITCMEPVHVDKLNIRRGAPKRQICPHCKDTVALSYIRRHPCPEEGFFRYRKKPKTDPAQASQQGT